MKFDFDSKTTYLAYRAAWKQRYFDQIKAVRAAKQGIKDANRHNTGIWAAYRDLATQHQATQDLLTEKWEAAREAGRQMDAKRT